MKNLLLSKKILSVFPFLFGVFPIVFAQSVTFNYTGAPQTWTVPTCVNAITVTVAGAEGGGGSGGNGAVVVTTINVTPGQVLNLYVGGSGSCPGAGWNGGGIGHASYNPANATWNSCGGGGASDIRIGGTGLANRVVVASGGGGEGGGSVTSTPTTVNFGGNGGCATGVQGGATFGLGAPGGTQTAGGAGGTPWASTPPGGSPGVIGVGGQGGPWDTASGGGGGGGYYGGGGGGNDGCCTNANGGGGGGGGSSLTPSGGTCTAGTNNGPGYITINYTPAASASNTGPYCLGSTIQLNGGGGTNYVWTGPNGFNSTLQNPTIPAASATTAGSYTVSVDGGTCTASTTVVVVNPPTPNAGPDQIKCLGQNILLDGTKSNAANTASWSFNTGAITPVPTVTFNPNQNFIDPAVTVNQPGIYAFILNENNGVCPSVRDTVLVNVSVTNHTATFQSPSCSGMSDGSITINNPDGVEYSYDNGATYVTNSTQNGLPVGTYTVISENQYGCQFTSTVTITEPAPILISAGNDTLVCQNGTANMWANINASGMNEIYHWSNSPATANTGSFVPTANITVQVFAEAANGCMSDTASIQINVRPPLTGTISQRDTVCPGYPTSIGVSGLAGGIGAPYDIVWSTNQNGTGTSMDITVNPMVTTTYTATITDACESTPLVLTTVVEASPLPIPKIQVLNNYQCEKVNVQVENITDPALSVGTYWEVSNGEVFVNMDTITTFPLVAGLYDVFLSVTTPFGCVDSLWFNDAIVVNPKPIADFKYNPIPVYMFNTQVNFVNYSLNADTYQWYYPEGIPSSSQVENNSVKYPDGVTGTYEVTLIAMSNLGCSDTVTQLVHVLPEILIYAPNTFTPDDDEFNQSWGIHISGIDIYQFELLIYNRWGELIWESHDPEEKWDGTYNGEIVQQGTYNWTIRCKDLINDDKLIYTGHINLLR